MERETEKNNELCKNSNLSVPVGQLGNDYFKSYLFKYNLKKKHPKTPFPISRARRDAMKKVKKNAIQRTCNTK